MLTKLLRILEDNQGQALNLAELSQQLDAQPSAIAGMLEILARKGRIEEAGATCGPCDSCGLQKECNVPPSRAKQYRLPSITRNHSDLPNNGKRFHN